jgi:hypothetical protein
MVAAMHASAKKSREQATRELDGVNGVEGKRKYPRAIEAAYSRAVIHRVDALVIEQPLTFCSKGRREWISSLRTHGVVELRQIIRISKLGRAAVGNAVWPRVELRDACQSSRPTMSVIQ